MPNIDAVDGGSCQLKVLHSETRMARMSTVIFLRDIWYTVHDQMPILILMKPLIKVYNCLLKELHHQCYVWTELRLRLDWCYICH